MKAITIKQPWAYLIAHGIKDVENRTWKTNYRGRVLIHASSTPDKDPYMIFNDEQASLFIENKIDLDMLESYTQNSQIIGSIEIVDCVQNHPSVWAEKGVWNWALAYPILFPEPIPAKGKLSFWDYHNIHSKPDEDNKPVCMCDVRVDEKVQVMSFGNTFRCNYCGGKWYK